MILWRVASLQNHNQKGRRLLLSHKQAAEYDAGLGDSDDFDGASDDEAYIHNPAGHAPPSLVGSVGVCGLEGVRGADAPPMRLVGRAPAPERSLCVNPSGYVLY